MCTEEIDRLIDILALGIANICYGANPETVILGGGIMEQESYVRPRLEKALMQYLILQVWKNTKICMAEYKNDAGMIGAFYHFRAMQKKRK
ncbi:ROK family protein [Fusicatenibacter sp.]